MPRLTAPNNGVQISKKLTRLNVFHVEMWDSLHSLDAFSFAARPEKKKYNNNNKRIHSDLIWKQRDFSI